MSDALVKIMNLPCTGFDDDGEETVNREAAAEIANEADARIAELELKLAHAQNVAAAWEDAYTLHRELGSPATIVLPREPHSWK